MVPNYTLCTDDELLVLLGKEKPQAERAFAELYQRYHLKLYNHCKFLIYNKAQAEDIFQLTWTRFFESVKRGSSIPNVPALLFTIANNLYKNYVRDMKHIVSIDDADSGDLLGNIERPETPGDICEREELMELINIAINLLEEELRQVFIMKKFDGMTFKEISNVSGITVECAKKRLIRATEKIMKYLQPYINELRP